MVLIKNQTTATINALPNYGGEVLYNTTTNRPVVNTADGFNYFVLSTLTGDVTGLASISATTLTGTLDTAAQPNVTSVGTLAGLTASGVVNFSSHDGSTTGLQLGDVLVTSTAAQLNYTDVVAGTAENGKALVLDNDGSIVGITNLETDNLTVNGTLVTASAIELNYTDVTTIGIAQASKALVLDENLNIVGINNLETDNLTVNGTLVTASALELNYTDVNTLGIAQPSQALVVDANIDITGINALSATSLSGTLQTAAQPNITSVGTLSSLLVSGNASVGTLTVGGVSLSPYGSDGLRTRVFSNMSFNGATIYSEISSTVNFTSFAPSGQVDGYSLEIWGYVKPLYTEDYTFTVNSNDHFRLWINNNLVRANWTSGDHTTIQTDPIPLVANTWYPIYIQHIQVTASQNLSLLWESTSQISQIIPSGSFSYDDKGTSVSLRNEYFQDSLNLYDSTNSNISTINVSTSGDLLLNSFTDNVNIVGHDGSSKGLQLNGTLVTSSAVQLNYNNVTPGTVSASKAMVVDSSRNITNLNNLTMLGQLDVTSTTNLQNSLTVAGVNVFNNTTDATDSNDGGALTVAGGAAVAKKLYVGTDLFVGGDLSVTGPILKLPSGNTANRPVSAVQGYIRYNSETSQFEGFGAGNTWGSLGGVSDVDQNTKILAEDGAGTNDNNLRFFNNGAETMRITDVGLVGIGTNAPDAQLEINSTTGNCLRLTYNDANGGAVNFSTLTTSSDGNLSLFSSGLTTFIEATNNLDVAGHNGTTLGLKLAGVLVTSSAAELNLLDGVTATTINLNYVDVTPGTVSASKAMVVDSSRNILNLNNLRTTGNLGINSSAPDKQVEINSTTGDCLRLTYNDDTGTAVNYSDLLVSLDGNLTILSAGLTTFIDVTNNLDIAGHNGTTIGLKLAGVLVTSSAAQLNYTNVTPGTASSTGALVLDVNGEIAGITTLSAGTINVASLNITGSSGVDTLNTTGNVGINTTALDYGLEVNEDTGNVLRLTYNDGNGGPADNRVDFQLSATGTLTITPVGTNPSVNIAGHDGNTQGLQLAGTLVTSTAVQLNYNDVTPGTAAASKTLVLDASGDVANINIMSMNTLNTTIDNATGNTVAYPINVGRTTSDTPSIGLGCGIDFFVENSANTNVAYGAISVSANTITDAIEDGKFTVNLVSAGSSLAAMTLTNTSMLVTELVETSDRRVKENIVSANLEESFEKIMNLNIVDYNFIKDAGKLTHRGLIAQELKEVIPNAVVISEKDGYKDFHGVSSKELIGHLLATVQCMNKKFNDLETKYEELKKMCNCNQ